MPVRSCLVIFMVFAAAGGAAGAGPAPGRREKPGGPPASAAELIGNLNRKIYTGQPTDLVCTGEELAGVLRRLEQISGFQFMLAPDIDERVTCSLRNTPWDEALALILAGQRLNLIPAGPRGFKVCRGRPLVLAFEDSFKTRLMLFLYQHLEWLLGALLVLAGAAAGLYRYRKRRRMILPARGRELLDSRQADELSKKLLYLLDVEKIYRRNTLSLRTLAKALGISTHQLSWLINERLQENFTSLINRRRVQETMQRLAGGNNGTEPILEIAYSVGFNTKASFNRAFKKYAGNTPARFRQQQAEEGKRGPGPGTV